MAKYWTLFKSTFLISAFTLGGGYVIVPLMQRKFVDDLKLIDKKEMLEMVAIAQSAPGPIAINTSILIGYKMAGVLGAFVTILGTVLPPLLIMAVVSVYYLDFKNNQIVNLVLKGMGAGVAAVVVNVVIKMGRDILKQKSFIATVIMLLAFILAQFFAVNVALIIIGSGLLGLLITMLDSRRKKKGAA